MTRMSMAGAVAIALATVSVAACGGSGSVAAPAGEATSPAAGRAAPAVPQVTVAAPAEASIEATYEASGSFIPFDEAEIAAEGVGPVTAVRIDEGSRVAQGQVVVALDQAKAELAVKQAEAMLVQAKANFERSKSDLTRKQTLLNDKTVAPSVYDAFKAQYDAAAAGVDAADSALQMAKRRLADMQVVAPFAGVVRDKHVSVGQYVREGDTLFVLMRVDPLKLQFDVPEKYAERLAAGQRVSATVAALPGQTFTGTILTVLPVGGCPDPDDSRRGEPAEPRVPAQTRLLRHGARAAHAAAGLARRPAQRPRAPRGDRERVRPEGRSSRARPHRDRRGDGRPRGGGVRAEHGRPGRG